MFKSLWLVLRHVFCIFLVVVFLGASSSKNQSITIHSAITFTPTTLTFPQQMVGTFSSIQNVVVQNIYVVNIPIGFISLIGANPSDFLLVNLCPTTITSNSSCTLNVTFTPTATGLRTATIRIQATGTPGHHYDMTVSGNGSSIGQTITFVNVSPLTFTGGATDGTVVGPVTVTLTPPSPTFTGPLSLTGTNSSRFRLSSTTLPSNLLLNGAQTSGTYSINLVATQSGLSASPFTAPLTVIGTASPSTISAITLSSTTFYGGSPDGTLVGMIGVTMSPSIPAFSGTLSITGTDASSFRLTSPTLPSNLVTQGVQPAQPYSINIVATQTGATGSPFTQAEGITGQTATPIILVTPASPSIPNNFSGTTIATIDVSIMLL